VRAHRRVSAAAAGSDGQQQNLVWEKEDRLVMERITRTYESMVKSECARLGKAGQSMIDREMHFEAAYNLVEVRKRKEGRKLM
jgi:hypothetical protein